MQMNWRFACPANWSWLVSAAFCISCTHIDNFTPTFNPVPWTSTVREWKFILLCWYCLTPWDDAGLTLGLNGDRNSHTISGWDTLLTTKFSNGIYQSKRIILSKFICYRVVYRRNGCIALALIAVFVRYIESIFARFSLHSSCECCPPLYVHFFYMDLLWWPCSLLRYRWRR